MKIHTMEQRTPEWNEARSGKLTASSASKLVTPTGKPSVQYKGEIGRIIAEKMGLQEPEFIPPTYWMERGIKMEDEARSWFEIETGFDVKPVGFVESDCGLFGVSPDGLLDLPNSRKTFWSAPSSIIPVELKCPKPSTHIKWLMDGVLPQEHMAQVHMAMILTNAPFAYFMSYCPNVRPILVKVERTEFTETLEAQMAVYAVEFENAIKLISGEDNAEV